MVPWETSWRKQNCSHWDHKPKSSYEGRTVFNLITQFDLKYKEITLALGLTSVSKQTEN